MQFMPQGANIEVSIISGIFMLFDSPQIPVYQNRNKLISLQADTSKENHQIFRYMKRMD